MLVKVTQEHIDKAHKNIREASKNTNELTPHSCNCPVAAALKDAFKVFYVQSNYEYLHIGRFPEDNLVFSKQTPLFIKEWMYNWDTGLVPVEPFEFELSLEGVKL